ncbi:DUF6443 domain-containing protein, partial [Alistipes sp. OttesenSCG-928-B03]|nr:DUF6443 domain-containing protein [Alistipes sp. OttesenSCG-928-B03]
MRRALFLIVFGVAALTCTPLTAQNNSIQVRTYTEQGKSAFVDDITIYDALGYIDFVVNKNAANASSTSKDIITPFYYDNMRRESRKYLPYAAEGANEDKTTAAIHYFQAAYYNNPTYGNETHPYSETEFEASPLSRPLKDFQPGKIFRTPSNKYVSSGYSLNTELDIRKIEYISSTGGIKVGTSYLSKELYKFTTTNEDGSIVHIFKNQLDQVVLERRKNNSDNLDTYYLYDVLGRVVWVITPEALSYLGKKEYDPDDARLQNYAYMYKYDNRGNVITKRVPDKGVEYMVYDKGDRLVLYQDAVMREKDRWIYTVYDNLNRIMHQSLVRSSMSRENIQARYDSSPFDNRYPFLGGATNKYKPFPDASFSLITVLSENQYDEIKIGEPQTQAAAFIASPQTAPAPSGQMVAVHPSNVFLFSQDLLFFTAPWRLNEIPEKWRSYFYLDGSINPHYRIDDMIYYIPVSFGDYFINELVEYCYITYPEFGFLFSNQIYSASYYGHNTTEIFIPNDRVQSPQAGYREVAVSNDYYWKFPEFYGDNFGRAFHDSYPDYFDENGNVYPEYNIAHDFYYIPLEILNDPEISRYIYEAAIIYNPTQHGFPFKVFDKFPCDGTPVSTVYVPSSGGAEEPEEPEVPEEPVDLSFSPIADIVSEEDLDSRTKGMLVYDKTYVVDTPRKELIAVPHSGEDQDGVTPETYADDTLRKELIAMPHPWEDQDGTNPPAGHVTELLVKSFYIYYPQPAAPLSSDYYVSANGVIDDNYRICDNYYYVPLNMYNDLHYFLCPDSYTIVTDFPGEGEPKTCVYLPDTQYDPVGIPSYFGKRINGEWIGVGGATVSVPIMYWCVLKIEPVGDECKWLYEYLPLFFDEDGNIRPEYHIGDNYYMIPSGYLQSIPSLSCVTGWMSRQNPATVELPNLPYLYSTGQLEYTPWLIEAPSADTEEPEEPEEPENQNFVERAYYYDSKGRVVQTVEKNHLGGISRYSTKYDFIGNILAQHESHERANDAAPDIIERRFAYDHRSRLLADSTRLNGGDWAVVDYHYTDLGQLAGKTYGSGANAVTDTMTYNIQGWLTEQSNDLFEMKLRYYDPQKPGTTASYTGNITEWDWHHCNVPGAAENTYAFSYDKLGRMTDARHYEGSVPAPGDRYREQITGYTANGNIRGITRYGNGAPTTYANTYDGNRLLSLREGSAPAVDYGYDANGNCTRDGLNGLDLKYNFLNLIAEVSVGGVPKATYSWRADGVKTGVRGETESEGLEYLGSLIYKRTAGGGLALESAGFSNGRILAAEGSAGAVYTPNYFITDHLGSVRVVIDGAGNRLQTNDY